MLLAITMLAPIAVSAIIFIWAWRYNRRPHPTHIDPTNPLHFPHGSRSVEHGEWVDTIQGERK